jgi:predicted nucleic acid-binding protein
VRRYLLDTGPLSAYFQGRQAARTLIDPWVARREVATTILSYAELIEYLGAFPDFRRQRTRLRHALGSINVHDVSSPAAERYAEIRRRLRPPAGPGLIGDIDTLIAAIALARGLTLVTTDSDFTRVPDLDVMVATVKP